MFRITFLFGVVAAVLLLAASALAANVHVRVEGVNKTIFGKTEPRLSVFEGPLRATDGSVTTLSKPTALGALESASRKGEFAYRLKAFAFGLFVDKIGRFPSAGVSGWVFKVNGASPPVGAADVVLEDGDRVLWYHATFGPEGGPQTLSLETRANNCIRAHAVDDSGRATRARDVVFKVNDRRVSSKSGQFCPSGRVATVRARKAGMVRSELIRLR